MDPRPRRPEAGDAHLIGHRRAHRARGRHGAPQTPAAAPASTGPPTARRGRLGRDPAADARRSEEHTSELQSLMRISYAVFCLKKKKKHHQKQNQEKMTTT